MTSDAQLEDTNDRPVTTKMNSETSRAGWIAKFLADVCQLVFVMLLVGLFSFTQWADKDPRVRKAGNIIFVVLWVAGVWWVVSR